MTDLRATKQGKKQSVARHTVHSCSMSLYKNASNSKLASKYWPDMIVGGRISSQDDRQSSTRHGVREPFNLMLHSLCSQTARHVHTHIQKSSPAIHETCLCTLYGLFNLC